MSPRPPRGRRRAGSAARLQAYRGKRDFEATPEPRGTRAEGRQEAKGAKGGTGTAGASFVVQKHAARRLHHDFRLELDGVLLSWAVPKGPPAEVGGKALAVRTEDHPLEYGGFEGIIPAGQYGAGTVMLWDRGRWVPEGDPRRGLAEGKLVFELEGERLRGRFALVRMRERDGPPGDGGDGEEAGREWLLIRRSPRRRVRAGASPAPERGPDRSVASGRTMEEIAAARHAWRGTAAEQREARATRSQGRAKGRATARATTRASGRAKGQARERAEALGDGERPRRRRRAAPLDPGRLPGARKAPQPARMAPQLARLAPAAPDGDGWLHEIKLDGYRLLAMRAGERVRLWTRGGKDWAERFPSVVRAVAALPIERAVLDGEVVVLDARGASDFQALQNSLEAHRADRHVFFAFDLPHAGGYDLTAVPLIERKALLAELLAAAPAGGALRPSEHVVGDGPLFLRHACELGLEGIVSKRVDARYEQRRGTSWIKTKCLQRQELVIGGWSEPAGSRSHLGALLLGVHDEAGALRYAGKVGTGFTERSLASLAERLAPLARETPPFADPPRGAEARGAHWVEPRIVAEVAFTEWTSDGHLRHPSFQGLREDKEAREVRRERAEPLEGARDGGKAAVGGRGRPAAARRAPEGAVVAGVRLSNPGRVLYPEQGITKRELCGYYEAVADHVLPHLVGRPLTLVRCPRGQSEKCFYQKHLNESMPPPVRAIRVKEGEDEADYLGIDDLPGLITLVQLGALELHPWGSRADKLERPDRLVLDLDPAPDVPWERVVAAAHRLRELAERLELVTFARTTGGKGLHVVLPIARRSTWAEAKEFTRDLVTVLAREDRKAYVLTATKSRRAGRIYLDYLRNARGATAIASYSARARPGAPVATPLAWSELTAELDPGTLDVRSVPRRLARARSDPWKGFHELRQGLTARVRAAVRGL